MALICSQFMVWYLSRRFLTAFERGLSLCHLVKRIDFPEYNRHLTTVCISKDRESSAVSESSCRVVETIPGSDRESSIGVLKTTGARPEQHPMGP